MIIFLLILIALILLFGREVGLWFVVGSIALIVIGIIVAAFIHVDSSNNVGFVPANPPQTLTPAQLGGTPVTPLKTKVVSAVPKTGYQVCSQKFPNETWGGTYGTNGSYICVCKSGYTWDVYSQSCDLGTSGTTYNPYGGANMTPQQISDGLVKQNDILQTQINNIDNAISQDSMKSMQ